MPRLGVGIRLKGDDVIVKLHAHDRR
jgi:hypothetical protein